MANDEFRFSLQDDERVLRVGSGLGLRDPDDRVRSSFVDERHPLGQLALLQLLQLRVVVDAGLQVVHDLRVLDVHAELSEEKRLG